VIAWWVGVALAHDPSGCPPLTALHAAAERGALPPPLRRCAEADADARGIVVLDDLLVGDAPDLDARARAWFAEVDRPEDALIAAERARDPALATEAIARATSLSPRWIHPGERALGLVRLGAARARIDPTASVRWAQEVAWLGVVGPPLETARAACLVVADPATCARPVAPEVPPADLPTADDLVPCKDLGRLWTRALGETVYGSERDCVVRALDGLDGQARVVAGRLVVMLAARHRDREAGLVAVHRVLALLPDDPVARSTAAAWHAELGDPIGATTWATPEVPR